MAYQIQAEKNNIYAGKRVLSVGASKKVLDNFTHQLNQQGFSAVYSNVYNNPEKLLASLDGNVFDVVALGRGVSPSDKAVIQRIFRAKHPGISFVEGLAPITGLLVEQVKFACLPASLLPAQIRLSADGIHIAVPSACQLQVKLYRLNWLYMSTEKILFDQQVDTGTFTFPVNYKKRKQFLTISQDGVVTGVIHLNR